MSPPLGAQARLVRTYAHEHGLVAPPVWALAQDSTGFLWVGTQAGLFRYDGNAFRRWAPAQIATAVISIAVSPRGRIAVVDEQGELFELTSDGAQHLTPPPGSAERELHLVAFDTDGRLWTVRGGAAHYLEANAWQQVPREVLDGETALQVREHGTGIVYVITNGGVWRAEPRGVRRIATLPEVIDLWPQADGRLLVLGFDSRLFEVRDGRVRLLHSWETLGIEPPHPRGIALTRRRGTVWIALDRYLIALRDDGTHDVLGAGEDIHGGGPLLVDREGSLWLGSFTGLSQFPEPETRLWNDDHGLPSRHTRFVARSGQTVWVSTWQGAGNLRRDATGWRASLARGVWGNPLCPAGDGMLWGEGDRGFLTVHDGRVVPNDHPRLHIFGCGRASDGGAWLATARGVWYGAAGAARPRRLTHAPLLNGDSLVESVYEDAAGRLWIASEGEICHTPTEAAEQTRPAWRCEQVGNTGKITSILEPQPGALWVSTMRLGVLARENGTWHPSPANDWLTTRAVFKLRRAREGGVWVVGHGILERIGADTAGRWVVRERPRMWHGLATVGGEDLLEDDDGTLWITTSLGVVQVAPAARLGRQPAPPVELVDVRIDDASVPLAGGLELPHHRNRLELEFAALSYRDRSLLRYQLRLSPTASWTEVREASFRWVDLPPGDYRAEVRASLDGVQWTSSPAQFAFTVLPPWYRSPVALMALAAATVALLWAVYRLRLAYLLGLERQRTRIAMDLHDEVGSGLGSIGILSGVLAANGPDHEHGRRLAAEIARATEELGTSLDDIIWSLDPRVATLEELANRLIEHGGRLFADGEVAFRAELPERWPSHPLPLTVRRTVLLIGLEALHNAARHASAGVVELHLAPRGADWELRVRDDGVGLPPAPSHGTGAGRGLASMRRRAAEIGAALDVQSVPGTGTLVVLRFALRTARGRWRARRATPGVT